MGWRIEISDIAIQLPFMSESPEDSMDVWGDLLSRNASLIRATFFRLEDEVRTQVLNHLQSMVNQPGWHEQQVLSAKIALEVFSSQTNARQENVDED